MLNFMQASRDGRELRRRIRHHVDGLGREPDSIAGYLAAQGVQGVPGNRWNCAIARYLHAVVGSDPMVSKLAVTNDGIQVFRRSLIPLFVRSPKAARAFVRRFDAGKYPDLVERPQPVRGCDSPASSHVTLR